MPNPSPTPRLLSWERLSFDNECLFLADHFLAEAEKPVTDEHRSKLAYTIQRAVEDWLAAFEGEPSDV